jgi:hypothetical protein
LELATTFNEIVVIRKEASMRHEDATASVIDALRVLESIIDGNEWRVQKSGRNEEMK